MALVENSALVGEPGSAGIGSLVVVATKKGPQNATIPAYLVQSALQVEALSAATSQSR